MTTTNISSAIALAGFCSPDHVTLYTLADLHAAREALDSAIAYQVNCLTHPDRTKPYRVTWRDIGEALGVSKQAAQQRYGTHESASQSSQV